jgi:hypothetical protein
LEKSIDNSISGNQLINQLSFDLLLIGIQAANFLKYIVTSLVPSGTMLDTPKSSSMSAWIGNAARTTRPIKMRKINPQ